MYAHFYQLAEDPFNLTPDPKYHYINESTREAMAGILHGIRSRKGFITLIGEAGTGKTTLLKRVVDEIEGETSVVFVFNPGVSFDELLEFICMELGIATEGCRRLQLLERLNEYLLEELTAGRNVVVMIDEAQTLDGSVLEELRMLSNLETSKEKILQILLSGQTELEDTLRRPALRQLRQRIAVRTVLKPVRPSEVGEYVATRLRSAGAARGDFFTPAALRKVWRASQGIPRVVNVICDNAMMLAFADGKQRISGAVMSDAIRDLDGRTVSQDWAQALRERFSSPVLRYVGAVVVAVAIIAPFALSMFPLLGGIDLALMDLPEDQETTAGGRSRDALKRSGIPRSERLRPDSGPLALRRTMPGQTAERFPGTSGETYSGRQPAPSAGPGGSDLAAGGNPPDAGLGIPSVVDTIRRAEILARSTAARLYESKVRQGVPTIAPMPVPVPRSMAVGKPSVPVSVPDRVAETDIPPAPAGLFRTRNEAADATQGLAVAAETLADALGTLADAAQPIARFSGRRRYLGPATGRPALGEMAKVRAGQSVWTIAVEHYGTGGPKTLEMIFSANPRLTNPYRLEVGAYLFLPFRHPERMVSPDRDGGYHVLVSACPQRGMLAATETWLRGVIPGAEFETEASGGPEPRYRLFLTGLGSREAALAQAGRVIGAYTSPRLGGIWAPPRAHRTTARGDLDGSR
ncbi:MAG: AAA family ATPase [Deltaproteobacteria bacterium]